MTLNSLLLDKVGDLSLYDVWDGLEAKKDLELRLIMIHEPLLLTRSSVGFEYCRSAAPYLDSKLVPF